MNERRLNKVIAGYHMLMIISHSDGDFSPEEGLQMVDYLEKSFPFKVSLDNELAVIAAMNKDDYYNHFLKAMDDFYLDSTEKERAQFLDDTVKMVMADRKITKEENMFLKEIFRAWDPDNEV